MRRLSQSLPLLVVLLATLGLGEDAALPSFPVAWSSTARLRAAHLCIIAPLDSCLAQSYTLAPTGTKPLPSLAVGTPLDHHTGKHKRYCTNALGIANPIPTGPRVPMHHTLGGAHLKVGVSSSVIDR